MNFSGKVAMITGATRGIGRAATEIIIANGGKVIATGRNEQVLKELVDEYHDKICTYKCDVSDELSVRQMVADATERMGKIDILINNAGIYMEDKAPFINQTSDIWKKKIDVNIYGTLYPTHEVLPQMSERRWGRIINIASVAGIYGIRDMLDYYWCGSSGKVWASSYDVIEYTCDDISKVLNSFNSFKLSKEICSRRHARILGYSGHKDYSLNDLLQWFKLIPLSSKKLLDNGMQILSISDTAESIGDNRIGSSIDSELFDVAVQLGPQYMDALFELKNTIDGFYYWRVCLLNSLEKTLPDVNTPDDKLVSIYRLANAWIVPSIEEKKEFNNLNFLNTINSKILQSISDTSLKEEILEKVPSISVNSLKDMSKPIGVSAYQVTSNLPEELEKQLPSIEDIQNRIK